MTHRAYNHPVHRAVVDVGSNSLILTVYREEGGRYLPVYETTRVTGLGKDTKTTGKLQPDRVEASLEALRFFREAAVQHGATEWAAGATMAVRIATNAAEFIELASGQGTPVTVVSGDLEARLGFLSVVEDDKLPVSSRVAIVDPGGHSTELTVARREGGEWVTEFSQSLAFGALGLRETALVDPRPDSSQRLAAMNVLDKALERVPAANGPVVVLGATGTNLVSIRDRMESWQPEKVHGSVLDYEEVGRAVNWLCDMDDAERAQIVGLEKGRETTIHAGTLILERCLYALKAESCVVSVHGWRHALANHFELVPGLAIEALA